MSSTETVDPRYVDIDIWPTVQAVEAMLEGQESAVAAIKGEEPRIAAACDAAAQRLLRGGRLVYCGAGTSGRLAVQDGVELGPTFGWPDERTAYVIAGGMPALMKSVEGAEDDTDAARREVAALSLTADDVVIGVAASGRTRFTIGAITEARKAGALTIAIANNRDTPLATAAEYPIVAVTGSEVIAGSTRMKAGTAQKAILNLLSTGTMLRCGRVYRGLMVDMIISNAKLQARAEGMVATLTGCDAGSATAAVKAAAGNIKKAVLIAMGIEPAQAGKALAENGDNLRRAIETLK
ncbi:MAG: N-acetylmuramic acid 6-phosphate etherase [Myxococcota bacterium]|nr:N-acetylmuramic acid 6-phosphate etherase [Myxococcota bacterium]